MPEILDPIAIWMGNMTSTHQPDPSQIVRWAKYVQRLAEEGVKVLAPCALATTGNVTLSGEQTIDGTLTSDTRVLVRAQTAPAENGIYNTGSGGWVRESDASTADELSLALVSVLGGETYAGTVWRTGLIETLGTDPVIWVPGATDAVVTAITEYVDEETSGKLSIIGALGELSGPFAGTARTNIGAASQAALDAAEAAIATKADAAATNARLAALEVVSIDSLTVAGGAVYELGESVTPTLDWTLGGPGSVTAQEISGAAVAPGTLSWTAPAAITADTTYTLTVTDASDRDVSRSVTVDFRNRVFWGASDSLVTDSAGVLALDGGGSALAPARARSFAVTTEGAQYVYYAYPAAWGAPGEVIAYGFPTSVTVTTISLTTAAGHTEEYQLLRLDQAQTGTVPMEGN